MIVSETGAAVPSSIDYVVTVRALSREETEAPHTGGEEGEMGTFEDVLRSNLRVFSAEDVEEGFRVIRIKAFDAVVLYVEASTASLDAACRFATRVRDGLGFVPTPDKPDASHFPGVMFKGEVRPPILAVVPPSFTVSHLGRLINSGADDYIMWPSIPDVLFRRIRSFARNVVLESEGPSTPTTGRGGGGGGTGAGSLAASILQYAEEHDMDEELAEAEAKESGGGKGGEDETGSGSGSESGTGERLKERRRSVLSKGSASSSALDQIQLRFKLGLIEKEKRKVGELQAKNEDLESQLEDLESRLAAFESPMNSLLQTVNEMSTAVDAGEKLDPAMVKKNLQQVIRDLTSEGLYEPIMGTEGDGEVLDSSKAWVLEEFSSSRGTHVRSGSSKWKATMTKVRAPFAFPSGGGGSGVHKGAGSAGILGQLEEADRVRMVEELKSLKLDVFGLSTDEIVTYVVLVFWDLGLVEEFSVDPDVLANFVRAAAECYQASNPYHNFTHAFDVLQTLFYIITTTSVSSILSSLDVLCLLVAAIAHDLHHPGVSNNFLVATRHDLAKLYNDRSVLENHHAASLYRILEDEGCNVLSGLSEEEWTAAREAIIEMILHTDMAKHFELVGKFSVAASSRDFDGEEEEDRKIICNVLLHAADISNPVKPRSVFAKWVDRVSTEFFLQGDAEKERSLPISPMMDRSNADIPSMEVNFINFVVRPLYAALVSVVPEVQLLLDNMDANKEYYESLRQ